MTTLRRYLMVRASGEVRIVTRYPRRVFADEVVIPLRVIVPEAWGRFQEALEITLPEPPAVEAGAPELAAEDSSEAAS